MADEIRRVERDVAVSRICYPVEILNVRCIMCSAESGAVCRVISDPQHPLRPEPHYYRYPAPVQGTATCASA